MILMLMGLALFNNNIMQKKNFIYPFLIIILFLSCSKKQDKKTLKEYKNAVSYLYSNSNNKTVFNLFTRVHWFKDNSGLWFVDYSKEKKQYKRINFDDYSVKTLFNYEKLVKALTNFNESFLETNEISFSNFEPLENGLSFMYLEEKYTVNLDSYKVQKVEKEVSKKQNLFESLSPNKHWVAYQKDFNLYIKSTKTNKSYPLTFDGKKGYEYASYYGWFDKMEGENGERPKRFTVTWSQDSKYISTNIVDTRNAEKMYLLDYNDSNSNFKPKVVSYYRGSPGDQNMVKIKPIFFDVNQKKQINTDLPTKVHVNSVSSKFSNKASKVIINYPERGFQREYVKELNLVTGKSKVIIDERSETNIDNFWFDYLKKSNQILFLSQRNGWRQMYLSDVKTQKTLAITNGKFVINEVLNIDEDNELIYFLASGKEENENPYHQKLYKTDYKGNITLLTPEKGHHIVNLSIDKKHFVDNLSTIQTPTKTFLRTLKTGKILTQLTTANVNEIKEQGWQAPEVFSLKAKDNKTEIYGAIWKPINFNPNQKYPIIDATYTGPHTQVFPKSFDRILSLQSLAELGFIVIRVDGLGTAGRSKEFLNHSYKNMGNNLEDHVLAIQYLANKYSWIDIDKVGVYGHSAGGYDTGRAMLAFPDFYKVGVASSADHDFRMEKAWWPEMYQGWPIDSTYQNVSNITNASNLKGKLLLVHGGMDDNVNPSATFKLAEALVNSNKEFDLLILPSQRHGYQGKARDYFIKKRWNYFIKHLQNQEPIWNFKLN